MDTALLAQLAVEDNVEAQCVLGSMFLLGDGVPKDAARALALFHRAANHGDPRAQCNLGAMYAQGIGVGEDLEEASRMYELSANQGNPDGLYNLALVYGMGVGGRPKNLAKAVELCKKALSKGHGKSHELLNLLQGSAPQTAQSQTSVASASTGFSPGSRVDIAKEPMPQSCKHKAMELPTCTFGLARKVEFTNWTCREEAALFRKPGSDDHWRHLYRLTGFANQQEVSAMLLSAKSAHDFEKDIDNVDGWSTFELSIIRKWQYTHTGFEQILKPIINERLLPYVRQRYDAPNAVVCNAALRRYMPDERRLRPVRCDYEFLCTAVLELNSNDHDGGFYTQAQHDGNLRQIFAIAEPGDLLTYQYDLPCGERVYTGQRYVLVCHMKDCMASCLTGATPWYSGVEDGNDPDALTALAQIYEKGEVGHGEGKHLQKAADLYKHAANLGHVEAMVKLAVMVESAEEKMRLYEAAAEKGSWIAQRLLGINVAINAWDAKPIRPDIADADKLLARAAEEGSDAEAALFLSGLLQRGDGRRDPDLGQAWRWLMKAADMGHPDAQHLVGVAYFTGRHVGQDSAMAAFWFRRASANGSAAAQCNLGAFCAQGIGGIEVDLGEAFRWYTESAKGGDADGQRNLATMYLEGLGGVGKDMDEARRWCEMAATQGHEKAQAMLREHFPQSVDSSMPEVPTPAPQQTSGFAEKLEEARGFLQDINHQNCKLGNTVACDFLGGLLAQIEDVAGKGQCAREVHNNCQNVCLDSAELVD